MIKATLTYLVFERFQNIERAPMAATVAIIAGVGADKNMVGVTHITQS